MTNLQKITTLLYGIFAASALMMFSFWTIVLGTIALLAALILAYAQRKKAEGTVYASHLTWLIRTFWIGGGAYMPILTIAEAAVLWSKIDLNGIAEKISSGEIMGPADIQSMLLEQYGGLMTTLNLAFTIPFAAWWLSRCWRGYAKLRQDRPVEKPMWWL